MNVKYRLGLFHVTSVSKELYPQNLVALKVVDEDIVSQRQLRLGLCTFFAPVDVSEDVCWIDVYNLLYYQDTDSVAVSAASKLGKSRSYHSRVILKLLSYFPVSPEYTAVNKNRVSRTELLSSLKDCLA